MTPTPWSDLVFAAKACALRIVRRAEDWRAGAPRRHLPGPRRAGAVSENRSPLWTLEADEEQPYQLGKVHNLRTAARHLNGIVIPAGEVFSFWKQLGRPAAGRGFVPGRMLRQGCMLPSVGGGLCQLSNALYQVALEAGCEIVERHAHSRVVPGSAAEFGRDATVAWNYVDLRFRAPFPMRLEVVLTATDLIVRLEGGSARLAVLDARSTEQAKPNSCFTCGEEGCHQHARAKALRQARTGTAFLVDENWPEFQQFVRDSATGEDILFVPLNGERFHLLRYRWPVLEQMREARWATLRRSWKSRRLAAQGAARQQALLESAQALAQAYADQLTPSMTKLVVAQSLLPFLWRGGVLGGRTFDVLLTRLPLQQLQSDLDEAFRNHPERATLNDFRAPSELIGAEAEALEAASTIITPHAAVTALFHTKARLLPWIPPVVEPLQARLNALGFAGPVVARRGAYEVREAARELQLPVLWSGANIEGAAFWNGVDARHVSAHELNRASVILAPAIVESRPQAALAALAAGVPVVATRAAGLPPSQGVTLVDSYEALLESALQKLH